MTTRAAERRDGGAARQLTLGLERGERFTLSAEAEGQLLRVLVELLTAAARRRLQTRDPGETGEHHE